LRRTLMTRQQRLDQAPQFITDELFHGRLDRQLDQRF
jgi:hypothetical protein